MKKKVIIVMVIIILLILLVPIPMHLKDGGTVEYKALTYKISKVHRLALDSETGYENGIIIEILGMKVLNTVNTNLDNNIVHLSTTEHYTKILENIPRKLTVDEAVEKNYFVYDAVKEKIYNEDILEKFINNTKIDADNRIADEIIIVIYNIEGDPILYNLGYDENIGYILAKDATRIDVSRTEILTDENYEIPDEFSKIVVDTNFPKEYYNITVTDTGFSSNAICLKSYSENYKDVEICRYMINK